MYEAMLLHRIEELSAVYFIYTKTSFIILYLTTLYFKKFQIKPTILIASFKHIQNFSSFSEVTFGLGLKKFYCLGTRFQILNLTLQPHKFPNLSTHSIQILFLKLK